jgi:hypothetical protein
VKKYLSVSGVIQEKLEDHMAFLGDEENACTSNKGPYDKSKPNDQTVDSPLKKIKKKSQDKTLIMQKVYVSTKTRAVDNKAKGTKHGQEKSK